MSVTAERAGVGRPRRPLADRHFPQCPRAVSATRAMGPRPIRARARPCSFTSIICSTGFSRGWQDTSGRHLSRSLRTVGSTSAAVTRATGRRPCGRHFPSWPATICARDCTRCWITVRTANRRSRDLERVEREVVRDNFFATATGYLNARGLRHRGQVRGRGLARDFFEAFAASDTPEIEEEVFLPEAVWVGSHAGQTDRQCRGIHVSQRPRQEPGTRRPTATARGSAGRSATAVGDESGDVALACRRPFCPRRQPHPDAQLRLLAARCAAAGLAHLCRSPLESQRALVAVRERSESLGRRATSGCSRQAHRWPTRWSIPSAPIRPKVPITWRLTSRFGTQRH